MRSRSEGETLGPLAACAELPGEVVAWAADGAVPDTVIDCADGGAAAAGCNDGMGCAGVARGEVIGAGCS